ncbi:MAG TPA: LamG-like jellyroll fold domain-containing protein, partial [Armatimonadota bacterium]|nr:LamG-like jellyroll fold domain-containing protein [Armatimonadota bacterium]
MRRKAAVQVAMLCLALAGAAAALAYDPADVIFYCPFDGSTAALNAVGEGSPVGDPAADFTDGAIGRAVMVGGQHPRLIYPAAGNINWLEGTISCFAQPVDWDPSAGGPGMLMQTRNGTDRPNFYLGTLTSRSRGTNFQVYFVYPGVAATMAGEVPQWQRGERKHVVATWKPGELAIYLDGELLGGTNDFAPRPVEAETFSVGPHRPNNPDAPAPVTAIDELVILRRALSMGEVRALHDSLVQRTQRRSPPLLRVGRCVRAPVIDGELGDPAWSASAGLTGLTNIFHQRLSALPTTVRVCYDDERFYVAYDCAIPQGARPVGSRGERDTGSPWHEDSAEVFLAPDPAHPEDHYPLVTHCAGLILDLHSGQKGWDGDWQVATSVTQSAWRAEVSVSFGSLGV